MEEDKNIIYLPPKGLGRGPEVIFAALKERREGPGEQGSAAVRDSSSSFERSRQHVAVVELPLDQILYSAFQLRTIEDASLTELVNSVIERGIIQPILVRPSSQSLDKFEIIAGERRYRAAKLAGLESVPALIASVDDRDSLELAIIENAQREDLNPIEEALAFQRLTVEFGLTQSEVAEAIGKSRVAVANAIRLLALPEEAIELIRDGGLSAGHGRVLLSVKDPELQQRLISLVVQHGMSVRALEMFLQRRNDPSTGRVLGLSEEEREQFKRWEAKISDVLKSNGVKVRRDKQGRKVVTIVFESDASWRRFTNKIRD